MSSAFSASRAMQNVSIFGLTPCFTFVFVDLCMETTDSLCLLNV